MKVNYLTGEKFAALKAERYGYFPTHDYWNIFTFIRKAKKDSNNKYVLLTHNSDWSVSKCMSNMGVYEDEIPQNLTWFAQNVDVEHEKIRSVPIGLENSQWHVELNKASKILDHKLPPINYRQPCFAYFNIETNKRRVDIYNFLSSQPWCKTKNVRNGTDFDEYIDCLQRYKFCICPEGNGIDTHRIWEALYSGCVPVVEDCINISFYKDLPIYVCNTFYDLNPSDMEEYYYNATINYGSFSLYKLSMEYWIKEIREAL